MWTVQREFIKASGPLRLRFLAEDECLDYQAFLDALVENAGFRQLFLTEMREAPYIAFRWETPPLHSTNADQPFECLLHDSPDLDVRADSRDFQAHFNPGADVVSFDNLGRDALLVVPCPVSDTANYSHIGAFHRTAPEQQQHALWQTVARSVLNQVGPEPLWLSTAGGGVDWLHVRLDARPKYYRHTPWRHRAMDKE